MSSRNAEPPAKSESAPDGASQWAKPPKQGLPGWVSVLAILICGGAIFGVYTRMTADKPLVYIQKGKGPAPSGGPRKGPTPPAAGKPGTAPKDAKGAAPKSEAPKPEAPKNGTPPPKPGI